MRLRDQGSKEVFRITILVFGLLAIVIMGTLMFGEYQQTKTATSVVGIHVPSFDTIDAMSLSQEQ